jgi:CheY-like chemotaxis protein
MELRAAHHVDKAPPAGAMRVLVVDDNADACDSTALLLQWKGCEARTALNGRDAIRQFTSFAPSLVLLDIAMPGMDGLEIARAIRGTQGIQDPVIAAVSGYTSLLHKQRCAAAGFDHYLIKPVNADAFDELLLLIQERQAIRDKTTTLETEQIAACYELLRAQLEFCGLILDSAAIIKEGSARARFFAKAQRLQEKINNHLANKVGFSAEQVSSLQIVLTGIKIRLEALQINNGAR